MIKSTITTPSTTPPPSDHRPVLPILTMSSRPLKMPSTQSKFSPKMAKPKTTSKLITWLFYSSHGILMLLAVGFSLCAHFTAKAESEYLGEFDLNITKYNVNFCYITSGSLIVAAGLGILAQLRGNKACIWILYCGILGFFSLAVLAEGFGALGIASNNMKSVKTRLRNECLEKYFRDPDFHNKNITRVDKRTKKTKAWDETQKKFECCGLDNYTDWQSVAFGRTSLTVPISCCNNKTRDDEWCGINVLPILKNPETQINPEGCFSKIIEDVQFHLQVMGYYSILVSIFTMCLVGAVSYLMVTKKM